MHTAGRHQASFGVRGGSCRFATASICGKQHNPEYGVARVAEVACHYLRCLATCRVLTRYNQADTKRCAVLPSYQLDCSCNSRSRTGSSATPSWACPCSSSTAADASPRTSASALRRQRTVRLAMVCCIR